MSNEIENKFNLAANYIQSNHHKFSKNLLQFYAFYKQSTIGELDTSAQARPSFFKMQERAKYDAWAALASMEKQIAMKQYVELLTTLEPEWMEDTKTTTFGVSVSMPKKGKIIADSEKTIEDFIREGNVEQLKTLISSIDQTELNTLDDTGLGLIHWSSDRGNPEVLSLVLNTKDIDVNLRDSDGQTALYYASSCGHIDCVELLLKHGADKSILDNEGSSCLDVAYDDGIKKLLS